MKHPIKRLILLILSAILAISLAPSAMAFSKGCIDVSGADDGYITINCSEKENSRIKVGITFEGETVFYDYLPEKAANFALVNGNGDYTISVYKNTTGIKYKRLDSEKVTANMTDELAPYRISTGEVSFAENGEVSKLAAALT